MNPEAEEQLKKILAKEIHELTPHDVAFMRARKMYIGKKSRRKFSQILDENPENVVRNNQPKTDTSSSDTTQEGDETTEVQNKLKAAASDQPSSNPPYVGDQTNEGDDDEDEEVQNVN